MPPGDRKDPSFMDVGALLAKTSAPPSAPPPPAMNQEANGEARAPSDSDEGAPAQPQPTHAKPPPTPARASASSALKLAVAVLVLVVLALVGLLLLPVVVRHKAVATAREAGLEIAIEAVGVGLDGARLRGVDVKIPQAPGVTAKIDEIHLASLSLRDVRMRAVDLRASGALGDIENKLGAVLAVNRTRLAGTTETPHHLSVSNARLTWQSGDGARLDAGDIGIELDSRGAGFEDVRGSIGRFTVESSKTAFGPWASSFERTPTKARVRVMFDPPVPDGPSALAVFTKAGGTELTELTVKVARSSFANLGIKPAELGLPTTDATDVQLSITGTLTPATRSSLTFDATLFGLRPKGFSGPTDVHVEGAANSTGGKPYELEKTSVTLGPFVAGVSGTVTPHDRGLRLDAMFKTLPLACERLARTEAKNMGPLVATLQAFGEKTGALRVTGAVNASGVVKFDTAQPDAASVAWLAKETCGVSIFGM